MDDRKVVFISDGASKIGRALIRAYAAADFTVLAGMEDLRSEREPAAEYFLLDMANDADAKELAEKLKGRFGRVDILIHTHNEVTKLPFESADDAAFERALNYNAKSAFTLCRAIGRIMKDQGFGSIVFVSSIHDEKPCGTAFAYSLAKGAVKMLCKEVSMDLGVYGVRCNLIELGGMEGDDVLFDGDVSPLYVDMLDKISLAKAGTAQQVANLVMFVASDACPMLNGSEIRADGALTLRYMPRAYYEDYKGVLK